MEKDYNASLDALLKEKGFLREDGRRPSVRQVLDETYTVISRMVEAGPMFVTEIADVLHGCFAEASYGWRHDSRANKSAVSVAIGRTHAYFGAQHYGIHVVTLKDALKKVYGEYEKVTTGTSYGVSPNVKLLYKTEQSLVDYIKKHTTKRTIVVIEWHSKGTR